MSEFLSVHKKERLRPPRPQVRGDRLWELKSRSKFESNCEQFSASIFDRFCSVLTPKLRSFFHIFGSQNALGWITTSKTAISLKYYKNQ